jgi:hypothetical protein
MLKKFLGYFAHLLAIGEAARENKAEIKEIRRELRDLTLVVQKLSYEVQSLRE